MAFKQVFYALRDFFPQVWIGWILKTYAMLILFTAANFLYVLFAKNLILYVICRKKGAIPLRLMRIFFI
jgi:hypothetical protein